MKPKTIQFYLANCFLLAIPVLLWNILLASRLPAAFQPDIFWRDIPAALAFGENASRTLVFLLAFLMPLSFASRRQKIGLVVYTAGIVLYFASWLALVCAPESAWSNSLWGFLAPACTPVLWLAGIGLVGHKFYFHIPYRQWIFTSVAMIFLVFHNAHVFIIYSRLS